jgi:hypothetical protein
MLKEESETVTVSELPEDTSALIKLRGQTIRHMAI